jgi:DNA-binding MarR family transcriptional regulator
MVKANATAAGVMRRAEAVELPLTCRNQTHEALVSAWWTGRLLQKQAGQFFRQWDSSDAKFNLLLVLRWAGEPMTQKDIGRQLLVDKSNVTGLVTRLARAGLVRRQVVPHDRRSVHVTLTARGRRLIDEMDERYSHRVRDVMSALTEDEQAELIRLTRKMREGLAAVSEEE